jgi:hypothetical protein
MISLPKLPYINRTPAPVAIHAIKNIRNSFETLQLQKQNQPMKIRNINQIKFRNLVSNQDSKVKKMFDTKAKGVNHFDINNTFSKQIIRGDFIAD